MSLRVISFKFSKYGMSSLVGVSALLALTVVLASVTFVFVHPTNFSGSVVCSGRIYDGGNPHSTQIIEIRNLAGESVDMSKILLDIKVEHNGRIFEEKLWGFPIQVHSPIRNWSGYDFVDRRSPNFQRVYGHCYLGKLSGNGIWCVGEIIGFRIKTTAIKLSKGDTIKVTLYRCNLPITSVLIRKN